MSARDRGGPARALPWADIAASGLAIVIAGVFWIQRDYRERLSGVFPDFVLVGLVLLAVLLLLRVAITYVTGRTPRERAPDEPGEETSGERGPPLAMVLASMVLLAAWVVLLTPLGFTLSGILAYLAITIFIRRRGFRPRDLLVDAVVAIVVVWGSFLIFTRIFLVPLPVPPFLYG